MTGLVVIGGPTASGKSALALHIAEAAGGVVINADSRQLYRDLPLLTARPSPADEARAPHRLFGVLGADEIASAGCWLELAGQAITATAEAGRLPIVVGGTGLYLSALLHGLAPVPSIPPAARAEAEASFERLGGPGLHAELRRRDPGMAARLRPSDRQRLIRAFEVLAATGRSLADWRAQPRLRVRLPEPVVGVALLPPRALLRARIERRLQTMLEAGALEELRALRLAYPGADLPLLKAVAVPELLAALEGRLDPAEARARALIRTRQYAKRQVTWLRHQLPELEPLRNFGDDPAVLADQPGRRLLTDAALPHSFRSSLWKWTKQVGARTVAKRHDRRGIDRGATIMPDATYLTRTDAQNQATTQPMTGSEVVLQALVEQGVEVVFGYPGGAVLPLYDAIFKQDKIRHILVRHEQGAVHAAEGYARSTGKVGVVLVTSGPGATNTVTGLTDALMDSVPVVCLTGQVPTHMIGNDAFQEADTVGITRPCTKHNYLVKSGDAVARTVHEAFHVARSGRPGPVVIDLPKDILMGPASYVAADQVRHRTYNPRVQPQPEPIAKAVELMAKAHRPLFYVGGGVINAGTEASDLVTELVRATGFPITLTLMGLGAYPASDPQFIGMLGMHGTYEANLAMHDCDLMIAVGARFDDRVTGRLDKFSPGSQKIQIDIDPSSINKNVPVDVAIVGDAGRALRAVLDGWRAKGNQADPARLEPWWEKIREWQAKDSLRFRQSGKVIKPQYAIQRLYELTKDRETYITTEVGQHQMWAAQHYKFERPRHWMTSGGLGTMGYGLPSAMGVQVAHPEALVIDIAGEASWVMNMQEMSTIMQYRLPVKSFILNNSYMGMVRQWQEFFHGNRYSESYMDSLPDFVKLAEAFGAVGLRAETPDQVDDVIKAMIETARPVICDVVVDRAENVYPMIPGGAAHNEIKLSPADDGAGTVDRSEEGMVLV